MLTFALMFLQNEGYFILTWIYLDLERIVSVFDMCMCKVIPTDIQLKAVTSYKT